MDEQAMRAAAAQGDYGTAAGQGLKSVEERLAQAISPGYDAPTRAGVPGTMEHAATYPAGSATSTGAAVTAPPVAGSSNTISPGLTQPAGTTTTTTYQQYGSTNTGSRL